MVVLRSGFRVRFNWGTARLKRMGLEFQSFANRVAHMVHEEEILGDGPHESTRYLQVTQKRSLNCNYNSYRIYEHHHQNHHSFPEKEHATEPAQHHALCVANCRDQSGRPGNGSGGL